MVMFFKYIVQVNVLENPFLDSTLIIVCQPKKEKQDKIFKSIASQALGIASGAYELALQYSKERKVFGKEISKHQAIAFKLADIATEIEAARHLCMKAAWDKDQHNNYDLSGAMAKLYAAEMAMRVTVEAVQIHGGYGFVKEYHVERLMRDAKITQIYEGTSEIQKIVISRSVLRD